MPKIDTVKAIIITDNNQILILDKASNEYWDLPGGHVDKGEEPSYSILREMKEETGLQLKQCMYLFTEKIHLGVEKNVRFYLFHYNYSRIKLSKEHIDFKWVSVMDFRDYNLGVYLPMMQRIFDIYS